MRAAIPSGQPPSGNIPLLRLIAQRMRPSTPPTAGKKGREAAGSEASRPGTGRMVKVRKAVVKPLGIASGTPLRPQIL
jgi:hypothetical protein